MPEIFCFYGIVITIYYDEHLPPHFHARYGNDRAAFLLSGEFLAGSMPPRASSLVRDWAQLHKAELAADWTRAAEAQPLVPIPPLD